MFHCGAFRRRIVSNNQSFNVITLVSSRIRYAGSSSMVSHVVMLAMARWYYRIGLVDYAGGDIRRVTITNGLAIVSPQISPLT